MTNAKFYEQTKKKKYFTEHNNIIDVKHLQVKTNSNLK